MLRATAFGSKTIQVTLPSWGFHLAQTQSVIYGYKDFSFVRSWLAVATSCE